MALGGAGYAIVATLVESVSEWLDSLRTVWNVISCVALLLGLCRVLLLALSYWVECERLCSLSTSASRAKRWELQDCAQPLEERTSSRMALPFKLVGRQQEWDEMLVLDNIPGYTECLAVTTNAFGDELVWVCLHPLPAAMVDVTVDANGVHAEATGLPGPSVNWMVEMPLMVASWNPTAVELLGIAQERQVIVDFIAKDGVSQALIAVAGANIAAFPTLGKVGELGAALQPPLAVAPAAPAVPAPVAVLPAPAPAPAVPALLLPAAST